MQVHHHRLEYDVDSLVKAIRENDLPEVYERMLLDGLDLETALRLPD
jgi:hypothetical protein